MKKVLSLIAVAAMATLVSCGPSAEEKAKMEENAKRIADSIANRMADSLAAMEASMMPADTTAADTTAAAPAEAAH